MRKILGLRKLCVATICCFLSGDVLFAQSPLRWQFTEDDTFRVAFYQTSTTTSTVGKPPITLTSEMSMEMRWTVADVSATGAAGIKQSFERFKTKIVAADAAPVEFDSASKDEPNPSARRIAASVRPLIGKSFSVTMTSRGEISGVKLSQELSAAIEQFVVDDQIRSLFSTDGMRRTLQQAFPVLSGSAVANGDSWTDETKLTSPFGPLILRSTSRLENDVTLDATTLKRITATGEVNYVRQVDNAPSPMVVKEHRTAGEYLFDPELGHFSRSNVTQEITSLNRVGEGQLEIQTKSTMSMRLDDVADDQE
jgi:hypothetical protein